MKVQKLMIFCKKIKLHGKKITHHQLKKMQIILKIMLKIAKTMKIYKIKSNQKAKIK
jgi:hypothetical protein